MKTSLTLALIAVLAGILGGSLHSCHVSVPPAGSSLGSPRPPTADAPAATEVRTERPAMDAVIFLPAPPRPKTTTKPKAAFKASLDPIGDVLAKGPVMRFSWPEADTERTIFWRHLVEAADARGIYVAQQGQRVVATTDREGLDASKYSPIIRIPEPAVAYVITDAEPTALQEVAYVLSRTYDRRFFNRLEAGLKRHLKGVKSLRGRFVVNPALALEVTHVDGKPTAFRLSL